MPLYSSIVLCNCFIILCNHFIILYIRTHLAIFIGFAFFAVREMLIGKCLTDNLAAEVDGISLFVSIPPFPAQCL